MSRRGQFNAFEPEPEQVGEPRREAKLSVSLPKCLFGFKETEVGLTGESLLHRDMTQLMMDLLFGSSTRLFQKLYDEDLISDSFGHDYISSPQYAFSMVGGDTKDPDQLLKRIREEVEAIVQRDLMLPILNVRVKEDWRLFAYAQFTRKHCE